MWLGRVTSIGQVPEAPTRHARGSSLLHPPIWVRMVLALGVAAALLIALVRFVQANSGNTQPIVSPANANQEASEAAIVITQDQAPVTVRLRAGAVPQMAITDAVRTDIAARIAHRQLDGPLRRVSCRQTRTGRGGRIGFSCTAVADGIGYPFLGVADVRTRSLSYCKRDPAPVPSQEIPVSGRCRV